MMFLILVGPQILFEVEDSGFDVFTFQQPEDIIFDILPNELIVRVFRT
jgi:hypothetical protein